MDEAAREQKEREKAAQHQKDMENEGRRGAALLPLETLAAARAEVAELKALQAKERAAAEKLAEEEAKQRAVEKARLVLLASRYVLTMCLTACVRYAPCTYYVLAVQTAKLVSCHAHTMHAC